MKMEDNLAKKTNLRIANSAPSIFLYTKFSLFKLIVT